MSTVPEKVAAKLTGEFYVGQPVLLNSVRPGTPSIKGTIHQVVSLNHVVICSTETGNLLDAVASNVEPL